MKGESLEKPIVTGTLEGRRVRWRWSDAKQCFQLGPRSRKSGCVLFTRYQMIIKYIKNDQKKKLALSKRERKELRNTVSV